MDRDISYKDYPSIIGGSKANNTAPEVSKKTTEEIANEVINGKWGNGEERKKRLTEAGCNYDVIQARVNEKLGAKTTSAETTYTAKKGDTLSGITSKYNTTWQKIYEKNRGVIGSNPNLIRVGQVLKI